MKLFKIHTIIFLCFIIGGKTFSQNKKIDEARINFISQKLQLSANESKNFWPVYNEYLDEIKALRIERKKLFREFEYSENPAEAEAFIKKYQQLNTTENQIRSEYIQKFKQIIGITKTAHLLKAEEEFRLELVKILKSDKQD